MRLIDADKLKETLLHYNYTTEHNQIFRYINEQPTAYSVDEELEDYKHLKKWKSDIMEEFCRYDASSFEELVDNVRNKTADECIKIVKFHRDSWDGIEWAIRDIEELKGGGENEEA